MLLLNIADLNTGFCTTSKLEYFYKTENVFMDGTKFLIMRQSIVISNLRFTV